MTGEAGDASATEIEQLIRSYELYDRSVDVVSAFEALFKTQPDMKEIVAHFERYPNFAHSDGRPTTPDFTVAFNDNSALCAEIANLPRHEQGVDRLCSQILRYDQLTKVPRGSKLAKVDRVDVLLLVRAEDVNHAIDRILEERLANAEHVYKPDRRPTIVAVSRDADKYSFFRNRDPRNGALQQPLVHSFIDGGYSAKGPFWTPQKVLSPFMNDPIPPLYMAAVVWIKVLPVMMPGDKEFLITASEVHRYVSDQFGRSKKSEVEAALALLRRGRFISAVPDSEKLKVRRRHRAGELDDFARLLAERACRPTSGARRRHTSRAKPSARSSPGQEALFDPHAPDWGTD